MTDGSDERRPPHARFERESPSLAELVCCLLNRRDARAVPQGRAAPPPVSTVFVDWYRDEFWDGDKERSRPYEQAGSFLKRLDGALAFLKRTFPDDFFEGRSVVEIGSGRGPDVLAVAKYKRAAHVVGVEIDVALASSSARMLADHRVDNAEIVCADMADVPEIQGECADIVFSNAAFEHVADLPRVLAETHRILKPGGALFAAFSPVWRHYYGSHLGHELPFPWTHLLFSESTVRHSLEMLHGQRQEGPLYSGLNRMTVRDYRRVLAESAFHASGRMYQTSRSRVLSLPRRVPIVSEYYSGTWNMVAVRRDDALRD